MMEGTVSTLPSSTVFFMFADRYVNAPHFMAEGTRCPCTDVVVQTDKVATMLPAFAFWRLREEGALKLSLEAKRTWVFGRIHVHVDELQRAPVGGVEAALAENVAHPHDDVADIVCRAFGENEDPYHDVLRAARAPDIPCSDLEALEERFQELSLGWDRFRRREPDLYKGLVQQCTKGIRSCIEVFQP